VKDTAKMFLA